MKVNVLSEITFVLASRKFENEKTIMKEIGFEPLFVLNVLMKGCIHLHIRNICTRNKMFVLEMLEKQKDMESD